MTALDEFVPEAMPEAAAIAISFAGDAFGNALDVLDVIRDWNVQVSILNHGHHAVRFHRYDQDGDCYIVTRLGEDDEPYGDEIALSADVVTRLHVY